MEREFTLAKEVVKSPAWRWMPGMLAVVPAEHEGATGFVVRVTEQNADDISAYAYPEPTDAPTIGGCLHLVRIAKNNPYVAPSHLGGNNGWWLGVSQGETEAECVLKALLEYKNAAT